MCPLLSAALWRLWVDGRPAGLHSRMQHGDVRQHRWEELPPSASTAATTLQFALCFSMEDDGVTLDRLVFTRCKERELTLLRFFSPGQTVELLERPSERPGWCLVRTTDRSPPQEGLVPSSALCVSHSRSSVEMDCFFGSGKGRTDQTLNHWPAA